MAPSWCHCLVIHVILIVTLKGAGLLLLNTDQQQCDLKPNNCLKYIKIDLDTLVMSLSDSPSTPSPIKQDSKEDEESAELTIPPTDSCPSYTLKNSSGSSPEYTVYQQSRVSAVGTLKSYNNSIEFSINYWVESILQEPCNQYYKPNTGHFMHSSPYTGQFLFILMSVTPNILHIFIYFPCYIWYRLS